MKITQLIFYTLLILLFSTLCCSAQDEAAEEEAVTANTPTYSEIVLSCTMADNTKQRMNIIYNKKLGKWEFSMKATQLSTGMMYFNKNEILIDLYLRDAHWGEIKATFNNYAPTDVDDFLVNGTDGKGEIDASPSEGGKFTWTLLSKN
jgi:hypothetical protein